ncbi:MAG: phosphoribosylanthranilate isomerase [Coriobacteriia bacterium]|nr:phosphoribosylanthranilate isomerase [Coriobacteriia bacterium]
MRRTRIKICGLTRAEDVRAAVQAGADACGFIFAPSPRQVSIEQAKQLAAFVPPPVARVGVFVDADSAFIRRAIDEVGLTSVQFSGSEAPEDCDAVGVPVIKVVAVGTDFGFEKAEPFRGHAAALLLDTYDPQRAGGTSRAFDWHTVGDRPGWAPMFVAGGLHCGNVGEAVACLRPFAVDVSSGVESAPGIKDHDRIAEFCAAVRAADGEDPS